MANLDLSIFRQFPIVEGYRLEFRAEMFNAFNTPVYGAPTGDISSADFGRVFSLAPGMQAAPDPVGSEVHFLTVFLWASFLVEPRQNVTFVVALLFSRAYKASGVQQIYGQRRQSLA